MKKTRVHKGKPSQDAEKKIKSSCNLKDKNPSIFITLRLEISDIVDS